MTDFKISQSEIDEFQQNGAVCLRNVFDKKWIEKLEEGKNILVFTRKKILYSLV